MSFLLLISFLSFASIIYDLNPSYQCSWLYKIRFYIFTKTLKLYSPASGVPSPLLSIPSPLPSISHSALHCMLVRKSVSSFFTYLFFVLHVTKGRAFFIYIYHKLHRKFFRRRQHRPPSVFYLVFLKKQKKERRRI